MEYPHRPVLVREAVEILVTAPEGTYVDGTVGSGGHSEVIWEQISSKGRLICLDRDSEAIDLARDRLSPLGDRVTVIKANYAHVDQVMKDLGLKQVDGILLDIGISAFQIERSGRGFSFTRNERLDMRMDLDNEITAYHFVNTLPAQEIKKILREYGEEKKAGLIAKAIQRERTKGDIETSLQLALLIRSVFSPRDRSGKRHPATKSFQALRIAVNRELDHLKTFLEKAPSVVRAGGRLVIISYHSLEDRLVKQTMMHWERPCTCPPEVPTCVCGNTSLFRRLYRKGIRPGRTEVETNPRARSAILRAAERI